MKKESSKYFVITSLMMYFMPALIVIFIGIMYIFSYSIISVISVFTMPVIVFILAFAFGRHFTSRYNYKITEPENRAALYAPAFMPAIMLPFICMLTEMFSKHVILQVIIFLPYLWGIVSVYFFEISESLTATYIAFLICSILYGLFFVFGERSAAKKQGIKRDKLKVKYIAVFAVYFAVSCGAVGYYDYYKEITEITVDESEWDHYLDAYLSETGQAYSEGYGFPYEHGWSSVDLRPYYVENEKNKLVKLDEPASFMVSDVSKMPVLDGAEAAYPVYSAFANACYENIADIQEYAKSKEGEEKNAPKPIRFTNTVEAYKSLVNGDADIFFGAEPSAEQKKLAEDAGKELVYTPIGKEAFVFFVSEDNPVDGLTSEQIRGIYSGKVTNWKKLGGRNLPILAFQRPKNSGSQTTMEKFMGDTKLKEPLKVEFEYSMVGVISAVADYQNKETAIGYSFRYYATQMVFGSGNGNIKFLSLAGVYPSPENIADNSYPMTAQLYAISLADNDNEYVQPFLEFMTSEQGQQIVRETGYII